MNTAAQLLTLSFLIMISWFAWWLVLAGWGLLFARACGRRVRRPEDLVLCFWSGFALVLVFLMFWHFFRRVDGLTAALVAAIGLAGLALFGVRALARCFFHWSPLKIILTLIFLPLAAFVANHTLMDPVNFDTGLYHLPQILWIHTYRIVPGLGNLHGRLAFNQSYFLYVAMLDTGPWKGLAWHWASGPLLMTLVAHLALKLFSRLRPGEPPTRRIFWLLLAAPVLDQLNNYNISSPTPDIPVYALSIVLALELLDLVFLPPRAGRSLRWRVPRIVLVGLVGLTIKFNFVIMGLGSAALALALATIRMRIKSPNSQLTTHNSSPTTHNSQPTTHNPRATFRLLSSSAALALLVLGPYVARDVILSGWIAYPMPLLPMPVSWRLPRAAVDQEIAQITGFARDPHEQFKFPLTTHEWVANWWLHILEFQFFEFMVPLMLSAFCLLTALIQRRSGIAASNKRLMWLFLSVPAASLVFWSQTAPHPRFAGGALWIFAAGANAFILTRFAADRRRLTAALAAGLAAFSFWFSNPWIPLKMPGPDRGFHPIPRVEDARDYVTAHGLVIHTRPAGVVTDGKYHIYHFQNWDMPLPNTPYPKKYLRLRRPGDLSSGFVIDGPLTEKTS